MKTSGTVSPGTLSHATLSSSHGSLTKLQQKKEAIEKTFEQKQTQLNNMIMDTYKQK